MTTPLRDQVLWEPTLWAIPGQTIARRAGSYKPD